MLADGVIRILTEDPVEVQRTEGPLVHYLAWFPVVRMDKETSKVRPVFDASARSYKTAKSLNDCLMVGVNYLMNIIGFIVRFRMAQVAAFGGIVKAYLQCALNEDSVHACRFLYLADPSKGVSEDNIVQYCFQRLTFGINCSQYLLMSVIREHLKRQKTPLADELILNSYSDNIMILGASDQEVLSKIEETARIFKLASMPIHSFFSNSSFVNCALGVPATKVMNKVLGVTYDTPRDLLSITFHCSDRPSVDTKRSVLSAISANYDPCGLVSPALILSKRFSQDCWPKYKGWNEPLTSSDCATWNTLIEQWADITVEFPRYIGVQQFDEIEAHAFSDANPRAMCVTVYLVFVKNRQRFPALVFARTRLAPLKKPPNLPRLELTASELASKAINFIREQVGIKCKAFLWTDSKITLAWILTKSKTLAIYVANRVRSVRKLEGAFIGYVPTDLNPSDYGTKGLGMRDLQYNQDESTTSKKAMLWWRGPQFLQTANPPEKLYKIEEHPSVSPYEEHLSDDMDQGQVAAIALDNAEGICLSEPLIDLQRFSNLNRVWNATAYVKRFVKLTYKKPLQGILKAAPQAENEAISVEEIKFSIPCNSSRAESASSD